MPAATRTSWASHIRHNKSHKRPHPPAQAGGNQRGAHQPYRSHEGQKNSPHTYAHAKGQKVGSGQMH